MFSTESHLSIFADEDFDAVVDFQVVGLQKGKQPVHAAWPI
jgi:hypothetical protein